MVKLLAVIAALFFTLNFNANANNQCDYVDSNCIPATVESIFYVDHGRGKEHISYSLMGTIDSYIVSIYSERYYFVEITKIGDIVESDYQNSYLRVTFRYRYTDAIAEEWGSNTDWQHSTSFNVWIGDDDDDIYLCVDPKYPNLVNVNGANFCTLSVCDDGFYDDPSTSYQCDRPTPENPDCPFGYILINEKPSTSYCEYVDLSDLNDDTEENNCSYMQGGSFTTYVCHVAPLDACSPSGVCRPGCGYLNDDFFCFQDNPDEVQTNDLDIPDDADYQPFVEGACRVINGQTYCPQDESKYIQDDGTYPDGCGYVNDNFYCENQRVFVSHVESTQDFESLPDDAPENALLGAINNNLQGGFTTISNNISQIESSLGAGLFTVNDSIKEVSNGLTTSFVSNNAKLDDVIDAIEAISLNASVPSLDINLPTSNQTDIFNGVVSDAVIADVNSEIELALSEYDQMLEDTKALFNVNASSGFADSGYVENVVNIKGVSVDLGASALERFTSNYGIEHIIWLIVALTGLFIITGSKS